MEKSQVNTKPLHNFPLSSLKWGNDYHVNNRRCRRSDHSPNTVLCPPPPPQTPTCDDDLHFVSTCSDADGDGGEKERMNAVVFTKRGVGGKAKSEPRVARNRTGCLASSLLQSVVEGEVKEESNGEMSAADGVQKQLNLRPRRAAAKSKGDSTNVESQEKAFGVVVQQSEEINVAKSKRPRRIAADFEGVQKVRKPRVWISLSKDEIEEDIFILTGSKPSRKPKKWPKPVQNKLDNSFPGLAFVGISVEEYRRPDAMSKW